MHPINALGDLEISDAVTMRGLAHPVRLELLERLQRHGPATTAELSSHVDAATATTRGHLRTLEELGLVVRDSGPRRWRAVAKGIRFEPGSDQESQDAYRTLGREMFRRADELPGRWLAEFEPRLEPEWRKVSGFTHARLKLTLEEAEALDARLEELLEPYVARDAPENARPVRFLRYLLPESG
jgi:DNA-binding transcriptional ArsR family regulator